MCLFSFLFFFHFFVVVVLFSISSYLNVFGQMILTLDFGFYWNCFFFLHSSAVHGLFSILFQFLFVSIQSACKMDRCLILNMTLGVQCKMITAWKATVTMTTFEWLSTGVFSIVTGQLIATRKSPFTTFPRTLVRLFTCK